MSGKRILVTAMESGSGKTVLTCALLAALKRRGIKAESFKCGPDYIDPMFHTRVLGIPSRNLDRFLQGAEGVRRTLASQQADFAVIEGAMGWFDGVNGTDEASAWQIASENGIPAVLAVRPKGSSLTLASQIRGLQSFRAADPLCGILLTACRPSLYAHLKPILERETHLPVFGYLPPMEEAELQSRHLGLITAGEVERFTERFRAIAGRLEECADIDRILAAAAEDMGCGPAETGTLKAHGSRAAERGSAGLSGERRPCEPACRIAVARDEAFCFYYEDSLRALKEAGAELVFFSPVHDRALPEADGLYLGGGYPELFAGKLGENEAMRRTVREAVAGGLPTVAECGGFLYLQRTLTGDDGAVHRMADVFPGSGFPAEKLVRFGYAYLTADADSLLFRRGERVPAHEFHHWDTTENGTDLLAEKPSGRSWRCGFVSPALYAAFPHLHLGGELPLARRFADAAAGYRRKKCGP